MMLFVLSGLPGAGKTTRAREIALARQAILLSRDEIRASFLSPIDEGNLTYVMGRQAEVLLSIGYEVVVDSWNLTTGDEDLWYGVAERLGAVIQWIHIKTPVDVCVARDSLRPLSIGEEAVRLVAEEYEQRLQVLSSGCS